MVIPIGKPGDGGRIVKLLEEPHCSIDNNNEGSDCVHRLVRALRAVLACGPARAGSVSARMAALLAPEANRDKRGGDFRVLKSDPVSACSSLGIQGTSIRVSRLGCLQLVERSHASSRSDPETELQP